MSKKELPERKPVKKLGEYLKEVYEKYFAVDYGKEQALQKKKILDLDKIINALEEHKKEQADDITDTQEKINLLKKYQGRTPPFNNGASEEILSLTCYNDLSYCCGTTKTCPWRDSVLNLFGISQDEYIKIKAECNKKFMEGKVVNGDKKKNGN